MTPETSREKDRRSIAKFKLFDDIFMNAAFNGYKKETKFLIDTITGMDVTVKETETQPFYSNIHGHEVRLDIVATDKDGKVYHFEVQRAVNDNLRRRARFTAALVDSTLLKKGEKYRNLPDRYTIFITETDYFEEGLPLYHIENRIRELSYEPFDDGAHIIYVNGAYRDTNNPIGALMHDFSCVNPSDMINEVLRDRVKELKKTSEGEGTMCAVMEDRIKEEKIDLAEEALACGKYSHAEIAALFKLPLSDVEKLAEEMKTQPKAE
jgi:hypothetical protein